MNETSAPTGLLDAAAVAAVRFATARRGYVYRQVETFVRAVHETVDWYQVALARAEQQVCDLQAANTELLEQVSLLNATIEVVRVSGQPAHSTDDHRGQGDRG